MSSFPWEVQYFAVILELGLQMASNLSIRYQDFIALQNKIETQNASDSIQNIYRANKYLIGYEMAHKLNTYIIIFLIEEEEAKTAS